MNPIHSSLRRAMQALEKGRKAGTMTTHHAALHDHIQGLHDHPDTHPEAKAALAKVLEHSHGLVKPAKPARAPKPKAEPHPLVTHFVGRLRAAPSTEAGMHAALGELNGHPHLTAGHWKAIAHGLTGTRHPNKARAHEAIRNWAATQAGWGASADAVRRAYNP